MRSYREHDKPDIPLNLPHFAHQGLEGSDWCIKLDNHSPLVDFVDLLFIAAPVLVWLSVLNNVSILTDPID